jgi:hypothetical protein
MPLLLWGLKVRIGVENFVGGLDDTLGEPPEVNAPNCALRHRGYRNIVGPFQN